MSLNPNTITIKAVDSNLIGSIEVICRSKLAKIVLIGNPRWPPSDYLINSVNFKLLLLNWKATSQTCLVIRWAIQGHHGPLFFDEIISITFEPCMLRFWNFIHMDYSWKNSWHIFFFSSGLCPFPELCPFEKYGWNLVSKISQTVWDKDWKHYTLIGNNG